MGKGKKKQKKQTVRTVILKPPPKEKKAKKISKKTELEELRKEAQRRLEEEDDQDESERKDRNKKSAESTAAAAIVEESKWGPDAHRPPHPTVDKKSGFYAKIIEGGIIRQLFDGILQLVSEADINCSHERIEMSCMDTSHVALVAFSLANTLFSDYKCGVSTTLGMSIASVVKILKQREKDQSVSLLKTQCNDTDNVTFSFASTDQSIETVYTVKLMNLDIDKLGVPETEYCYKINLTHEEYKRICSAMKVSGDTVLIYCRIDHVKFSANGDETNGSKTCKNTPDHTYVQTTESFKDFTVKVSLRYLQMFSIAHIFDTITIEINPNVPIVVTYIISDPNDPCPLEESFLRFWLAPKIEDSDQADTS